MSESWEIRTEIFFPMETVAIGKDGRFLPKMEYKSRYVSSSTIISEEDAEKMWQFRQLLHGVNKLSEESTKDMEKLIMILQSAVNLGLKERLGMAEDGPPVVLPTGVVISALSVGFKIQQKDP